MKRERNTDKKIVTHCAVWAKDKNGLPYPKKPYNDGESLTPADQSYKESADINNILEKAKRTGVVAHINENAQFYADMTDFDYEEARNKIAETDSAFYGLSAELRSEFQNDPAKFRNTVGNMTPQEVQQKFPELAKPGKQFPDVIGGGQPSPPTAATPPDSGGGTDPEPATPDPEP